MSKTPNILLSFMLCAGIGAGLATSYAPMHQNRDLVNSAVEDLVETKDITCKRCHSESGIPLDPSQLSPATRELLEESRSLDELIEDLERRTPPPQGAGTVRI